MHRLIKRIEAAGTPEQKVTHYRYNGFGQLEVIIPANGIGLCHRYDALGRLSEYFSSDYTFDYEYTYDRRDRPLIVRDKITGTSTVKVYTDQGSVKEEVFAHGLPMRYAYDRLGRITESHLPDGSAIRYTYKGPYLHQVIRLSSDGSEAYTHTYEDYDLAGNLLRTKLPGQLGEVKTTYDLCHRFISSQGPSFQEVITERDAIGLVKNRQVVDPLSEITYNYAYDELYQLRDERGPFFHHFEHDSLYNEVQKDGALETINNLNQLLAIDGILYTYDFNGNRLSKQANGEITRYTYDPQDRLKSVESSEQKTAYFYDESNRRLSKTTYAWDGAHGNRKKAGGTSIKGIRKSEPAMSKVNSLNCGY